MPVPKKRKVKTEDRIDQLKEINEVMPPPSLFCHWTVPSGWVGIQMKLEEQEVALMCHRPSDMCDTHVSLYYKPFDDFVVDCQSLQVVMTDAALALNLSQLLCRPLTEVMRMEMLRPLLSDYFDLDRVMNLTDNTDGFIMFQTGKGIASPGFIVEGKGDLYCSPCGDPYMEVIADYVKLCDKATANKCRAPAFLMECFGTYVAISGAVFTRTVCVDKLTVFSALYQPNDHPAMEDIARKMKALKRALQTMQDYYKHIPQPIDSEQLKFPVFDEFNSTKLTYTKQLNSNVFQANTVEESPRQVVVKFVERYGTEVHEFCEKLGFAPQLLARPVRVTSRYLMVVMSYVQDATPLSNFYFRPGDKESIKKLCKGVLESLRDHNFCHGDFRSANILVVPTNTGDYTISVIDFDWAGRANEAVYPTFMNHIQLQWHPTASDGEPLKPEHDWHWFNKFFRED